MSLISGTEIEIIRPDIIVDDVEVVLYKRTMDPRMAVNTLKNGKYVLIIDYYSSGLMILNELKHQLIKKHASQSFQAQRDFREDFKELSNRLLLVVNNHQLKVKKAPQIGWFKILYPEINDFLIAFPQVQGLNSSWQWYEKGIAIPVLNQKIHPFFGTYFPTRFEHLKLFDNWLKKYKGDKETAIDIGVGCGVLSYQLLNHGFKKVVGTDTNPNAIIGLQEALSKHQPNLNIELIYGDLFTGIEEKTELIVFNPPWIPSSHNLEGMDQAIYYETDLFPRFFEQAAKYLKKDGRLVLLFSNLAQITKTNETHPIAEELTKGERFLQELFLQKEVTPASKKTKRNQTWRDTEKVELWVLKLNEN